MPTEHSSIDIYSFRLLRVLLLLCIVELRLSTLNKPISHLMLQNLGRQKMSEFQCDFCQLSTLLANISGTDRHIENRKRT